MRSERWSRVRRLSLLGVWALSLQALLIGSAYSTEGRPGITERLPIDWGEPSGPVTADGISPNGRQFSFTTEERLSPNDTNSFRDVYVFNRADSRIELVSATSLGMAPLTGATPTSPFFSSWASLSTNGRFVAFTSSASDLVPGDTNRAPDIFLRDRKLGTTERVSVTSDGEQAGFSADPTALFRGSRTPSISGNGRFVTFASTATNLVNDDSNNATDIFVHDRTGRATERVSVASDGGQADEGGTDCPLAVPVPQLNSMLCKENQQRSHSPLISHTGRFVAFASWASDLVPNDVNQGSDVFLHDRETGKTEVVSVASDETLGNSSLYATLATGISHDGRYISFLSSSSNLVPNDRNGGPSLEGQDVFVRDRTAGRTVRVSVNSDGEEGGHSWQAVDPAQSMNADGRYVVFNTRFNLVPEHKDSDPLSRGDQDVFLHDLLTGATEMISVNPAGIDAEYFDSAECVEPSGSLSPRIDDAGRFIGFWSCDSDLVHNDRDDQVDIFVRDRGQSLGTGGLTGSGQAQTDDENLDSGTELLGARYTYRPLLEDLFVAVEVEAMPPVLSGELSPILYGLRLKVEDKRYEVRATSLLGGTFGLFDCSNRLPACVKVTDLRGGWGTTGHRVVFSLPLARIGLQDGGELTDVQAFAALGSYFTGAATTLDTVSLSPN